MKGRREGPLGADQELPYNEITLRLTKLARSSDGGIEDLAAQVAALASTTRVGLLIEGGNRRVVLANQRFCNLFGVPMAPEQLAGGDGADYSRRSKALFADPEGYERRLLSLVMNAQRHGLRGPAPRRRPHLSARLRAAARGGEDARPPLDVRRRHRRAPGGGRGGEA
jgi:PAS domain-containing protein